MKAIKQMLLYLEQLVSVNQPVVISTVKQCSFEISFQYGFIHKEDCYQFCYLEQSAV